MNPHDWKHRYGLGVLAVLSLTAAACGGDDDSADDTAPSATAISSTKPVGTTPATTATTGSTAPSSSAPPIDLDPTGILRFGTPLISGVGVHFDPAALLAAPPSLLWSELIFGTLLRETADGKLEPWMAREVEVVDPRTVRIALRPGVTFTDGSAYDAEAVRTGLLRSRFEATTDAIQARVETNVGFSALTSIDVEGPLTLVAQLDEPVASLFLTELASIYGMIPSPRQIAQSPSDIDVAPVGAGPLVFTRFATDQVIELRKNPQFWDADRWPLAGVDFVHTPRGPAQTNGLLAGTIDINMVVPAADISVVEAESDLAVEKATLAANSLNTCSSKPPFDNVAVRKAIQIGFDRDEYNELVYGGLAEPAYGALKKSDAAFDPRLEEELAFDQEAARKLLSEANLSDISFDLIMLPTHNYGRNVEVIQSQLKELGITVNVVPMLASLYTEWIEPQKPGALIAPTGGQVLSGTFTWFSALSSPGGAGAFCGYSNPELMDLLLEAAALDPNDPKVVEKYREANRVFVDTAVQIPLVFEPHLSAWNENRVGGPMRFLASILYRPSLEGIYVKK